MGMGQDHCIEFFDPCLVQFGAELIPLVHIARINEDVLLCGLNEDGVPLPNIEHLDRECLLHGCCRGCLMRCSSCTPTKERGEQE